MATRRQHRWIIGMALFALTVGFLSFLFGSSKQPFHNGKSLQEWFDSLGPPGMYSENDPNVMAIVAIGGDAVPFLMRELCLSKSSWAESFRRLWSTIGLARRPYIPARFRREKAYYGLRHLRSKAGSALPDLIKIAENEKHPSCVLAIRLLGSVQSNSANVVQLLQKVIADPRAPGFVEALQVLSRQGTNARPALPRLREIQADSEIEISDRVLAASAALSINPGERQSLEFIVAQLDKTNVCRAFAASMLVLLETNAMPALPSMRRRLQSEADAEWHTSLSNTIHALETACGTESSQPR